MPPGQVIPGGPPPLDPSQLPPEVLQALMAAMQGATPPTL